MSNAVWVVEVDETDSRSCIGVFSTRKAMIEALQKRFSNLEVLYHDNGTPWYAKAWREVLGHRFYTPLDLTRMKLNEWNDRLD